MKAPLGLLLRLREGNPKSDVELYPQCDAPHMTSKECDDLLNYVDYLRKAVKLPAIKDIE